MPLLDDPWLPAPDSNGNIPAVRAGFTISTYRYDGGSGYFLLPNVECVAVDRREGTDPGHASFRYNLALGYALDGAPVSIEQALGTGFSGAYVVNPGDRLVVRATRPDGVTENLFDGLATSFGMGLDPESEEVYIQAIGIAWHAWDDPIGGAIQRGADNPERIDDTATDLVAHFNPEGLPNCTPDGYMAGTQSGGNDYRYPTFLDPTCIKDPDQRTYWTLAKAARYILFRCNPDQQWVKNPDGQYLDALLNTAGNPTTSGGFPMTVPDTPATGKDWPNTLQRLVDEVGVGMHFQLGSDDSGNPVTAVALFPQQGGTPKNLYLAPRGTNFSPTLFNIGSSGMHRDVSEVVNQVTVVGALGRVETSLILAPGFPSQASDAADANLHVYRKDDPTYLTTNRDKYRLYVFGETADGYFNVASTTLLTGTTKLDSLYGFTPRPDGSSQYCFRRRRAFDCLTLDDSNIPFKARLSISTNYAGNSPGIWDGTGTWYPVTSTTWQVLPDRIGIRITDMNPESWQIGPPEATASPFPGNAVRGVFHQSGASGSTPFTLRLTCSIDADLALRQTVSVFGSPLPQTIARVVDASDRYRLDVVDKSSELCPVNVGLGQKFNTVMRDDRPAATSEATAMVQALAFGVLDGPVTIPRLTTYYQVGDRIASIDGRGLGLRTDDGTGTPIYPVVVGVRHEFGPGSQATYLDVSDAGSDRRRYVRRPRRVGPAYVHPPRRPEEDNGDGTYEGPRKGKAPTGNTTFNPTPPMATVPDFGGRAMPDDRFWPYPSGAGGGE